MVGRGDQQETLGKIPSLRQPAASRREVLLCDHRPWSACASVAKLSTQLCGRTCQTSVRGAVWGDGVGREKCAETLQGWAAGPTWPALPCPPRTLESVPQETTQSAPRPPEAWRRFPAGQHRPSRLGGAQIPGSPDPPGSSW